MRNLIQLNSEISDTDAFEICFGKTERKPLFKLVLYSYTYGIDEATEETLEDPHSELFINIAGVARVIAVFRNECGTIK